LIIWLLDELITNIFFEPNVKLYNSFKHLVLLKDIIVLLNTVSGTGERMNQLC